VTFSWISTFALMVFSVSYHGMLHNLLALAGTGIVALIITLFFWISERTRRMWGNDFLGWWKAEAIMIWLLAEALLIIIVADRGCFRL
jgi:hypothetical protein